MLNPQHCDLFDRPFFQFAQMKQHQADDIPHIKAAYRAAWQDWQHFIQTVAAELGSPFAPPHIERWCNGWQVRAHFFAYFKYAAHQDSAVIFALILNRRRLLIHLDWHTYRAAQSVIPINCYHQWLPEHPRTEFANWHLWSQQESEYGEHRTVAAYPAADIETVIRNGGCFRIGRSIERTDLADTDCTAFAVQTIRGLQPLYETCFQAA